MIPYFEFYAVYFLFSRRYHVKKPKRMNVGVAVQSYKLYFDIFKVYQIEGQFIFIVSFLRNGQNYLWR